MKPLFTKKSHISINKTIIKKENKAITEGREFLKYLTNKNLTNGLTKLKFGRKLAKERL